MKLPYGERLIAGGKNRPLATDVSNVSAEHAAEIKTFGEKIKKYTECTRSSLFSLCLGPSTLLYTNSGQVVFIVKTGHDRACVDKTAYILRVDHPR